MKTFPLAKVQTIRQLEMDQAKHEVWVLRKSIQDVLEALEQIALMQKRLVDDRSKKLAKGAYPFELNQDQVKIKALKELKRMQEIKLVELRQLEALRLKVLVEKKQTVSGLDKLHDKFLAIQAQEQRKEEADFIESTLVHKQR